MGIREQQHNVRNSSKKKEQIVLKCKVLFFWANRSLHLSPALFLNASFFHPCRNVCSGVVSGTITLFQHRGGDDCQLAMSVSSGAGGQETPSLMADNSNLLGRRGEDISLRISSPANAGGNDHSWHRRELKYKCTRPQIA